MFRNTYLNGKVLSGILVIFLFSILVRWPTLDRPLSKHHEFVTAISLRVLQVWHQDGGAKYNFVPVMNYPGSSNKFINNHASPTGNMMDQRGNYYYVSHPPLAYIIPHYVFQMLNTKPTVLSLQMFHLFVNFLSAFCVYLIAINLKQIRARSGIDRTAFAATTIYLFSSAVLWFQSNAYMSDMLVHFFFLIGVFITLKLLQFPSSKKWKLFFVVNLVAMIYTSWLGVFFAAVVFFGGLIFWKNKNGVVLAVISISVTVATLILIFYQYSSVAGQEAFIDHLLHRISVRGSADSGVNESFGTRKIHELGVIVFNYGVNYFPLFLMILISLLFQWRQSVAVLKEIKVFLFLSMVPIAFLHLVLLNYSGHDFTVLYASLALSVVLVFLMRNWSSRLQVFSVVLVVFASIAMYYVINRPGPKSQSGDLYATSMDLGLFIKENARPHEIVVLKIKELDPMVVVYAERNIIRFDADAPLPKAPYIFIDRDTKGNFVCSHAARVFFD